jgi:hypothetical protein
MCNLGRLKLQDQIVDWAEVKSTSGNCEELVYLVPTSTKYLFTGCFILLLVISGFFVLRRRYEITHYPNPNSRNFTVAFSWNGGLRNIAVVNDSTGKEEENIDLARTIKAEARKNIPIIVARMGLQRATGNFPCLGY